MSEGRDVISEGEAKPGLGRGLGDSLQSLRTGSEICHFSQLARPAASPVRFWTPCLVCLREYGCPDHVFRPTSLSPSPRIYSLGREVSQKGPQRLQRAPLSGEQGRATPAAGTKAGLGRAAEEPGSAAHGPWGSGRSFLALGFSVPIRECGHSEDLT